MQIGTRLGLIFLAVPLCAVIGVTQIVASFFPAKLNPPSNQRATFKARFIYAVEDLMVIPEMLLTAFSPRTI